MISVTSLACNSTRILQSLLLLRANRESLVTATASTLPLRTARSMENKPGRQKELSLVHSQLWPTIQYPLQFAHSRSSSSCCSAAERCRLPVRAYNQTRGKKSTSSFLLSISHLRIVIRESHPVPATRFDPAALNAEGVDAIAEQRSDKPFQFGTATM